MNDITGKGGVLRYYYNVFLDGLSIRKIYHMKKKNSNETRN